jgi:hypothetical protein
MVVTSLISRAMRSTGLRIRDVELDEQAIAMLAEDEDRVIRLIARRPRVETGRLSMRSTRRSAAFIISALTNGCIFWRLTAVTLPNSKALCG